MSDFSALLLALYRSSRQSSVREFPLAALAQIGDHIRFDSGRWARSSRDGAGRITVHHAHLFNEPPQLLTAYGAVANLNAPLLRLLDSPAEGPVGLAYNSESEFRGRAGAAMREYQRRYEHENTLNVLVKRRAGEDTQFRLIALHRARSDRPFNGHELAAMRRLLPHLLEASTINRVACMAREADHCIGGPFALGLADQDRSLLFADPRVAELLRLEGLSAAEGRLPVALWECLARGATYAGREVVAQAQEDDGMLFVQLRRRCAADALTPRELEAARLDAAGRSYKEIALAMRTAPATARNQLQRVHAKLGARNRADVAAALALRGARDP